jgi:hypothetical protein
MIDIVVNFRTGSLIFIHIQHKYEFYSIRSLII